MKTPVSVLSQIRLFSGIALVVLGAAVAVCDLSGQSTKSTSAGPTGLGVGADGISSIDSWSNGANLPTNLVRAVGIYFPANGLFYAMGGRTSDTAGSDSIHPLEYNPGGKHLDD